MSPSQGLEFVQYIKFVAEVMPDNKHTPENTNNLKAIITNFCEFTKIPKPDVYLQIWCVSDEGEYQNIEIHFDDGSIAKLTDNRIKLFGADVVQGGEA